jgi:hypothetical protein
VTQYYLRPITDDVKAFLPQILPIHVGKLAYCWLHIALALIETIISG